MLVLGSFIPAIPQIVEDMQSSPPIIRYVLHDPSYGIWAHSLSRSLTINLAMFAMAFGNLVWASYSGFCESSDPLESGVA